MKLTLLAVTLVALSLTAQRPSSPVVDDVIAPGTFSILGFDPATGEIGAAVHSKVFSVGNGVLWAEAGVGAVATQAIIDVAYGPKAMDLLRQGLAPKDIIKKIYDADSDPGYNGRSWPKAGRQFAVMNPKGEFAAFTGPGASTWAGDKQGEHCTAQGNILKGPEVVAGMVDAFEKTEGHIAKRLVAALLAGDAAGGDTRGKQSAALIVVKKDCGVWLHNDVVLKLQVDDNPEPIHEMKRLVDMAAAPRSGQMPCYRR